MDEPMITVNDVARMLNVSVHTVYRLKSRLGGIPAYKVGGRVRFKRDEVEAYLAQRAVKPVVKRENPIKTRFQYVPGMRVV